MFEAIINFFKGIGKTNKESKSKDAAKERLHLVLMQDRANISADFLSLMKQEIIEVIKKYIDVDETAIDVRLTNKANNDGTTGAPVLYANIPILSVKEEAKEEVKKIKKENKDEEPQEARETKPEEEKQEYKKEYIQSEKDQKEDKKEENNDQEPIEVIEKAEEIVEELKEETKIEEEKKDEE